VSEKNVKHGFSRAKKVSDFLSGDREAKISQTLTPEKLASKLFSDFRKSMFKTKLALTHKTSHLLHLFLKALLCG
jgi:hypothetical protein